eukprot:740505-Hanusia_phi.AAC.1
MRPVRLVSLAWSLAWMAAGAGGEGGGGEGGGGGMVRVLGCLEAIARGRGFGLYGLTGSGSCEGWKQPPASFSLSPSQGDTWRMLACRFIFIDVVLLLSSLPHPSRTSHRPAHRPQPSRILLPLHPRFVLFLTLSLQPSAATRAPFMLLC